VGVDAKSGMRFHKLVKAGHLWSCGSIDVVHAAIGGPPDAIDSCNIAISLVLDVTNCSFVFIAALRFA
jgi:hypothetical protein